MYSVFSKEQKNIEQYQKDAIDGINVLLHSEEKIKNSLLYFTMGKGKTLTAVQVAVNAEDLINSVIVVAPPSTHKQWDILLTKHVTVPVKIVSHQWLGKNEDFLKKNFSNTLVVIDELHQSANRGKTLTKLVARLIKASFAALLMSGTPFRNKEERLYVVHDWLFGDAESYESWLHKHCDTEPDRFAYYPKFLRFKAGEIEDFLESIDRFAIRRIYIEKEALLYKETQLKLAAKNPSRYMLETFSVYGKGNFQIANSVRQKLAYMNYLNYCESIDRGTDGEMALTGARMDIIDIIEKYSDRNPIVYCFSSKVSKLYFEAYWGLCYQVDGKTTKKNKELAIAAYKERGGVMFATDSISTGTDGLQEVTNAIIIIDDTMDGTNREQLIGRIAGGFRNKGDAEVIFIKIE